METIRTFLALAAQMELEVFQLNVKLAFLNGDLEEEVYVERLRRRSVCRATEGIHEERRRRQSLSTSKGVVWPKASSKSLE